MAGETDFSDARRIAYLSRDWSRAPTGRDALGEMGRDNFRPLPEPDYRGVHRVPRARNRQYDRYFPRAASR